MIEIGIHPQAISSIPPLGSIPPNIRQSNRKGRAEGVDGYIWKNKKYKPSPKSAEGLKELLKHALEMEKEMIETVKIFPDDKNLEKLDNLQKVIKQLKFQISIREEQNE